MSTAYINDPTSLFKIPILTGLDDFAQWKSAITDTFLLMGLWDVVTKPVPNPKPDSKTQAPPGLGLSMGMEHVSSSVAEERTKEEEGEEAVLPVIPVMTTQDRRMEDNRKAMAVDIWTKLLAIHDLETPEHRAEIKRELSNYFLLEGADMKEHLDGFLRLLLKASAAGSNFNGG